MHSFADLFKGRDDVHGVYEDVSDSLPTARGKRVAKARTVQEPVTDQHYKDHLDGVKRLGIVPVRTDGTVVWFLIDVDFYQGELTHPDLAARIATSGVPLVQTMSKSGGAHLHCFLDKPMPATHAKAIAATFIERLGLPQDHIEIFPKQNAVSEYDLGSWVNLPYFGETCYCPGPDGSGRMTLDEFLVYANERLTDPASLRAGGKTQPSIAGQSPNPPCIDAMVTDGVGEGNRNNAVVQYAIFAKRAFPDDWRDKTADFNEDKCDPPLKRDEIRQALRGMNTKDYQYLCDRFQTICNKTACRTRQFGIGAEVGDAGIEHIEKIEGEDPIYRITLDNGKRFQCGADELLYYKQFKGIVFRSADRILPNRKQSDWEEEVKALLANMEISKAALDTQNRERIFAHFKEWASQGCVVTSLEDALLSGVCFFDGESLIFRGEDFLKVIDKTIKVSRSKMFVHMRDFGVVQNSYRIRDQHMPLWAYIVDGDLWFDPYRNRRA